MEQIDAQVSDLRYLTQAAVPLPPDRAANAAAYSPHNHSVHSPLSATPGGNSAQQPGASRGATQVGTPGSSSVTGSKRKSEDESNAAKQQRSKRNRVRSLCRCLYVVPSLPFITLATHRLLVLVTLPL
ncbi:hypothetical protein BDP67DRAFT_44722 [Colletotrichum lupini]|nr:hypothetical protein BDP67DRAFT_44722 [Colletotrichum lupini]